MQPDYPRRLTITLDFIAPGDEAKLSALAVQPLKKLLQDAKDGRDLSDGVYMEGTIGEVRTKVKHEFLRVDQQTGKLVPSS